MPVEDTKSSPDKYAEMAKGLAVDVIGIPYYGTSATAKTALFWTTMEWQSIVTFQFYLADKDEFISRLDAGGTDKYTSGLFTLIGTAVAFVEPIVGTIVMGTGLIVDLTQTVFKSSDSHWQKAFKRAIEKELEVFLETYPSSTRTTQVAGTQVSKEGEQSTSDRKEILAIVLKTKSGMLLLNKGSMDGVSVGLQCKIYEKGSNYLLGEGEISKVREDQSVASVSNRINFQKGDRVVIIIR